MTEAPVWLWPVNAALPIRAGTLFREEYSGAGEFLYDADFLAAGGRALDPGQLRHCNARQACRIKASEREGVPGILADAGPDSWGRRVLAQDLGFEPNALEALVLSADDGAGNLAVGDLAGKPPIELLDLGVLAHAIQLRSEGRPHPPNKQLDGILSPDTALGGAKPKATTLIDGFPWIAKFPERGDPVNLPYYEAVALRVAGRLGMDSSITAVEALPQGKSVLLVKRFDRRPDGIRLPFASGLTVLGPAAQSLGPARTYLKFAQALRTWTREPAPHPSAGQLWERFVYNGLVGNIDDHPRNHALIKQDGTWQLSPIFDVVPTYIHREKVALAMPFVLDDQNRAVAAVSAGALVRAAPDYGLSTDHALHRLIDMATQLHALWPEVIADLKAPPAVAQETQPVLEWSARLLAEARTLTATDLAPRRTRRQGWHWQP